MIWQIRTKNNTIKPISVSLIEQEKYLFIQSAFDRDLIDEIKQFDGAKWDSDNKVWRIKNNERNQFAINYLQGNRVKFSNGDSNSVSLNFSRSLFQHQRDAVSFILSHCRALLAFEMGLGKTLVGIEVMERLPQYTWWLVAPYGAQKEWQRQLLHWNAQVKPSRISTYESLKNLSSLLPPQGIIFDESIRIKNSSAQRSEEAARLCKNMRETYKNPFIILFNGAPAPKNPIDWWHQLEIIWPGWIRESSAVKFRNRYANIIYKDGPYGKYPEIAGWKEDELVKLGKRISPIVLRKEKKDCLDLPEKIKERIKCEISEKILSLAKVIVETEPTALKVLEHLRQLSDGFQYREENSYWIGSPKIEIVNQLLDFYCLENGGPGRLVIYASYRAVIEYLMKMIKLNKVWNGCRIDGRGWSNDRILDEFEETNGCNYVIVANPACVHGITLSKTECLVYYDNSFSVEHRIQSIDRRDRPGMDVSKGTRIIDLIHLPIDEYIVDKLEAGINLQQITLDEIKRVMT